MSDIASTASSRRRGPWIRTAIGVSALAATTVACGDDDAGAGGGQTTVSVSVSVSVSAGPGPGPGPTGSTASTTGTGGGLPGDCRSVSWIDTRHAGGVFALSSIDPPLGNPDVPDEAQVRFYLENFEGQSIWNGAPGSYDLSAGIDTNFETCARCLLVFEDFGPTGIPAKYYFQSRGTLHVESGSSLAETGEGSIRIEGARLVEVTIHPETFVSTPVPGGECLEVEAFSYAFAIPATWECLPSSYGGGDGCDCECGAPDPDCDIPGQTIPNLTLFGCDDPGAPYCTADGTCGTVPAAWTCDASAFADGASCDCNCGDGDPDCRAPLPIDGCMQGQSCNGLGRCTSPETACQNFTDDDNDGMVDCDDPTGCRGTPTCTPGSGPLGSGCSAANQCAAEGGAPFCFTEAEFPLMAGGMCAEWCSVTANDCPSGAACADIGRGDRGLCYATCTTNEDCDNPLAACIDAGDGPDICIVQPAPEVDCDDNIDNDEDGNLDCADPTNCQMLPACEPGEGAPYSACTQNADCSTVSGPDPLCVPRGALGAATRFCTEWCDLDEDCPDDLSCFDVPEATLNQGVCLAPCGGGSPCDDGQYCTSQGFCSTSAPEGWICAAAYYGTGDGCDCGCGILDPDCAGSNPGFCEFCFAPSCANDGFGACQQNLLNPANNAVCL